MSSVRQTRFRAPAGSGRPRSPKGGPANYGHGLRAAGDRRLDVPTAKTELSDAPSGGYVGMMGRGPLIWAAVAVLALTPWACGGNESAGTGVGGPSQLCAPGSTQLCNGPGACEGAQACDADGMGYGPCDCGAGAGGSGPGGSGGTGVAGGGGATGGHGGGSGGVGGGTGGVGGVGGVAELIECVMFSASDIDQYCSPPQYAFQCNVNPYACSLSANQYPSAGNTWCCDQVCAPQPDYDQWCPPSEPNALGCYMSPGDPSPIPGCTQLLDYYNAICCP